MSAAPPQPTGLLPGQSPPLSVITATDHSGVVAIVAATALTFALVSILIRIYVRLEFSPQRFSYDDAIIGLSTLFAVVQSATVFVAVTKGFGRTMDEIDSVDLQGMEKSLYVGDIFYIIALWLSKASVVALFLRLSPNKQHVLASRSILGTVTATGLVGVLIVALRCHLAHPWIDGISATCSGLFTRWQTVAAFDIITEILLFLVSIYIIHGLQMSFSKKAIVVLAFGFRLPVIAASALRLHFLSDFLASADPAYDGLAQSICTQTEINYAIIAATIPCLRPFMAATATNYGAPAAAKKSPKTTAYAKTNSRTGRSGTPAFGLAALSSKLRSAGGRSANTSQLSTGDTGGPTLHQQLYNGSAHRAPASHQNSVPGATAGHTNTNTNHQKTPDQHSLESTESRQMFIRKDVDYSVEYEAHQGKVA